MKVAIAQERIISGGRMVVINELVSVLNDMGIVPDILTFDMALTPEDIQKKYQKSVDFRIRQLPFDFLHKTPETSRLWFNYLTRRHGKKYDLLINSNNTETLLTKKHWVISYVHYPRLDRIRKNMTLHTDGKKSAKKCTIRMAEKVDRFISGLLYKSSSIGSNILYVANSRFTKQAIISNFNIRDEDVEVIYPPVDVEEFHPDREKANQVATIGRFSSAKRQFEQIKMAEKLPDLKFVIMGFAGKHNAYYNKCKDYVASRNIENVELCPDLPFSEMVKKLEASRFFLHTTKNEPFGITTVQGIAAGCIPVTHNSGGQKEIVFRDDLRYENHQQAVRIFKKIMNEDLSDLYDHLAEHIRSYQSERFRQEFTQILDRY
ncbi:MAG: glycosyltransferase [Bacteroidales bacterium]|nr:glycosyltransferase [Bacteroidales bacterium]